MKPKNTARPEFALIASVVTVLGVTAHSFAQDATGTNFQRPALILEGAKVSTEAQAKELAWQSYWSLMFKDYGISATEGIRVSEIITLGFEVPGYAKKGDRVWEMRVVDLISGLRAILWIHAESEQTKFLISPPDKKVVSSAFDMALPNFDLIEDVTLERSNAGKELAVEEFRQMMKTAKPMSQEEWMKHATPAFGCWYKGSFTTPTGTYHFELGLGGVNTIMLDGASMRFKFNEGANR